MTNAAGDELLTMVRLTLRELFAEYKDLQVVEQWEHKDNWVPRATLEEIGELDREDDGEDVERLNAAAPLHPNRSQLSCW
jgi:RIO-like serine/threonine protein kinase